MAASTLTSGSVLIEGICLTISELWVHESLVDPHLESIPSLRTIMTRSFPCSYSPSLGRHSNRSFHFEILFLHASAGQHMPSSETSHCGWWEWSSTFGSSGVLPVSLKGMAVVWFPDQLVPQREWALGRQEQDWVAQGSATAVSESSSKSMGFLIKKIWPWPGISENLHRQSIIITWIGQVGNSGIWSQTWLGSDSR